MRPNEEEKGREKQRNNGRLGLALANDVVDNVRGVVEVLASAAEVNDDASVHQAVVVEATAVLVVRSEGSARAIVDRNGGGRGGHQNVVSVVGTSEVGEAGEEVVDSQSTVDLREEFSRGGVRCGEIFLLGAQIAVIRQMHRNVARLDDTGLLLSLFGDNSVVNIGRSIDEGIVEGSGHIGAASVNHTGLAHEVSDGVRSEREVTVLHNVAHVGQVLDDDELLLQGLAGSGGVGVLHPIDRVSIA